MNARIVAQHLAVEGHVAGLALVIELLAQPRRDFGVDLSGVDGPVVAGIDGKDQPELADVGRHRRCHVGVLQLAGKRRAVVARGAVHLAEGGGSGGFRLERGEGRTPVGAQFARHAPLDEAPAHGRRPRLQGAERVRVFIGKAAGDGGEQLGDLHQRPLEAAERALELFGVSLPVGRQAEVALARHARRDSAHRGADPRIAAHTSGQSVVFAIRHDRRLYASRSRERGRVAARHPIR